MYITYCRNQKTVDVEDKTSYRASVTGGDYRPTWLIRVSDWKRVPGEEAVDGYHTLSYCWEQSGEVVKRAGGDDEYDIIVNGEHCIVEGYDVVDDFVDGECLSDLREVDTGDVDPVYKEKDDKYVTWCEPRTETTTLRHVTYEELLQQLCKDFQVEYLWYDKVCIDQSDKKHKLDEIKQMHSIYGNARYTIAVVPEIIIYDAEEFNQKTFQHCTVARHRFLMDIYHRSCWWKRSWTLEEVMMSKRILIVGTDTNMFQHSLHTTGAPRTLLDNFSDGLLDFRGQNKQQGGSVNQALSQAHFRTSTKPHDRIFALANTFTHMFDDIEVSYSADAQTTFDNFYRHIARKDLSILCFGANLTPDNVPLYGSTIKDSNLPSWTGVDGQHHVDDIKTNRYWKISITRYEDGAYGPSSTSDPIGKKEFAAQDHIRRISADRLNGKWTDLPASDEDTILREWLTNMRNFLSLYTTHYHYRHQKNSQITQVRPLSLTEDCEGECIVLPILLEVRSPIHQHVGEENYTIEQISPMYLLPVFSRCSQGSNERYKAVGVYLLGNYYYNTVSPTFNWNHCVGRDDVEPVQDPENVLNVLFENDYHDVPKEFIVE